MRFLRQAIPLDLSSANIHIFFDSTTYPLTIYPLEQTFLQLIARPAFHSAYSSQSTIATLVPNKIRNHIRSSNAPFHFSKSSTPPTSPRQPLPSSSVPQTPPTRPYSNNPVPFTISIDLDCSVKNSYLCNGEKSLLHT